MSRAALGLLILAVFVGSFGATAQKGPSLGNLQNFDRKLYHFGFLLSYNKSDFRIRYKPDFTFTDSLMGISNAGQPGFNLALLASFNPVKNLNFRFIPGLSFQDRNLQYSFLKADGSVSSIVKKTEAVYLDFPLLLKMRTNRVGNFAAYALVGAKYSLDMQSQKDVDDSLEDQIILKLANRNWSIDAGGGFDFFLQYFKFGIELKVEHGMRNILIQENTRYSAPIESLRSRAFILSFTFEG
jgi:hypothetical protein